MPDKVTYEFAVIRLLPKVERDEFLNLGVIVFSKHRDYLDIKYHLDETRIKSFAAEVDIDLIARHLKAWALVCNGNSQGTAIERLDTASRFRWLVASRSTILQTSKVHPGLCTKPEKRLDNLFDRYVL